MINRVDRRYDWWIKEVVREETRGKAKGGQVIDLRKGSRKL